MKDGMYKPSDIRRDGLLKITKLKERDNIMKKSAPTKTKKAVIAPPAIKIGKITLTQYPYGIWVSIRGEGCLLAECDLREIMQDNM